MSRPAIRERLDNRLSEGSIGCFKLNAGDRELRLYLMHGAIVAAHSSTDDEQLLRRLVARGEIDTIEFHQLAQEESELPLFDRLIGRMEEKRLEIAFFDRFRDNLTWFVCSQGEVDYTPMESIMVSNIQLSHDTSQLLQTVDALVDRTRPIRERLETDSMILHGENSPQHLPEQELSSLLNNGITLTELLERSPFEYFETLDILGDMLIAQTASIGIAPAAATTPEPAVITAEVLEAATTPEPAVEPEPIAAASEPTAEPAPPPAVVVDIEEDAIESQPSEPGLPNLGPRLKLAGPSLPPAEARRKIEDANEVLKDVAAAFDGLRGHGSGAARIQLLVDGTAATFGMLYHQVTVAQNGSIDTSALLENLRRRPDSEHMRLVNEGLLDLVERVLSTASDELPEDRFDSILETVSGYQKRILS